jgi:hypothetical protein
MDPRSRLVSLISTKQNETVEAGNAQPRSRAAAQRNAPKNKNVLSAKTKRAVVL